METIKYLWENETIRYIVLSIVGLTIAMLVILFIVHLKKVRGGQHSKFLWFETGQKPEKKGNRVRGKNVNTGTNFGKIGDN